MTYQVQNGDITKTQQPQDAIVTLINSSKMWFGGVDGAIQRVANWHYHSYPMGRDLRDGDVIVGIGDRADHSGNFDHVIFVVDDLQQPLGDLVYLALLEADKRGYNAIALPLMRSGVMLGAFEPDLKAVVAEIKRGIERFLIDGGKLEITIVVYNDAIAVSLLS